MSRLNFKDKLKISILSKDEKRSGYIMLIYKDCPVCGNSKNPFWVKKCKCSKCGADKFKWHTSAWCGNLLTNVKVE